MIILKTLTFDNLFSYGKGNVIKFNDNPITQLIGLNGHGKSSIALILEETLYNKNSKGIKKADILNRNTKDKSYKTSLTFSKDNCEYEVQVVRGSTQTVTLFKDGDNISAHTATSTYKMIEDIMGMDHKAFSQLVYQSSASSLEFLTATDTNRKKFLIDLLCLDKYVEAFEIFKKAAKTASDEVIAVESTIKTIQAWKDKHANISLEIQELKGIPVYDDDPKLEIAEKTAALSNIEATNRRITKNNQYRENLASIDTSKINEVHAAPEDDTLWVKESTEHSKSIKDAQAFIKKIATLNGTCPTCLQEVDRSKLDELIADQEEIIKSAESAVTKLTKLISENKLVKRSYDEAEKLKAEYEQYHSLVDESVPLEPLDSDSLVKSIKALQTLVSERTAELEEVEAHNTKVNAHNSKVQVIREQLESMSADLIEGQKKLEIANDLLAKLQILQKTFSTNGLIAYKIECMVKDLEDLTNKYLAELSSGRFQIYFKVTASDKLNVIITDNGRDIDIAALSGGERARVNTATLLAIRSLMQSLSNSRINLLVLDETIDSLDAEGKEKLVEVLLTEEHLNTFLVSHGFTHPLLEKITVIKENNISRLE